MSKPSIDDATRAKLAELKAEREAERNGPRTMKNSIHWRSPSMPREDFEEVACAGATLTALLSKMQMKIGELEKRVVQLETQP